MALDINSIYKGKSLENPKATGKCFLKCSFNLRLYVIYFNVDRAYTLNFLEKCITKFNSWSFIGINLFELN